MISSSNDLKVARDHTFLISIGTDAGGDLVLEFIPDVIHRFPIMRVFRIE
jgi:hypothetical protein